MTNWKRRTATFIAAAIAVASGPGCSVPSSSDEEFDPNLDDTPSAVVEDFENNVDIAVACGPNLQAQFTQVVNGVPRVPGAVVTLYTQDGDATVVSDGTATLWSTELGADVLNEQSRTQLPDGANKIGVFLGEAPTQETVAMADFEITIDEDGHTVVGTAYAEGVSSESAYAYDPNVAEYTAEASVTTNNGPSVFFSGESGDSELIAESAYPNATDVLATRTLPNGSRALIAAQVSALPVAEAEAISKDCAAIVFRSLEGAR